MTILCLDGWAGRLEYPVEIIGETPKRYRIRALVDIKRPHGKNGVHILLKGGSMLVPKYAVRNIKE